MIKTQGVGRGSTRRFPYYKLTSAGVDFFDAYLRLATPERRKVVDLLQYKAFLLNDVAWGGWRFNNYNAVDRQATFIYLRKISDDLADAWDIWALEISRTRPSRSASLDALLALVGRMVFLKFREAVEAGDCQGPSAKVK